MDTQATKLTQHWAMTITLLAVAISFVGFAACNSGPTKISDLFAHPDEFCQHPVTVSGKIVSVNAEKHKYEVDDGSGRKIDVVYGSKRNAPPNPGDSLKVWGLLDGGCNTKVVNPLMDIYILESGYGSTQ